MQMLKLIFMLVFGSLLPNHAAFNQYFAAQVHGEKIR